LALGRTAVLDGGDDETLAQDRQERLTIGDVDLDGRAVEDEGELGQLKD
jgi:hypothetical protein